MRERGDDWRRALWLAVLRVDRRWIAVAVVVALLGLNFLFTAHYVNSSQAAFRHQQATEAAAQRRAAVKVEKELCEDVGTMAQIRPPAGNPATNPSRAFDDADHRAWLGLAVHVLDCKKIDPATVRSLP